MIYQLPQAWSIFYFLSTISFRLHVDEGGAVLLEIHVIDIVGSQSPTSSVESAYYCIYKYTVLFTIDMCADRSSMLTLAYFLLTGYFQAGKFFYSS